MFLPLQSGKSVLSPVGSCCRSKEPHPDDVFQDFLQRLAVLLVQSEQHERSCQGNQKKQGNVAAQSISEQEVGTGTDHARQSKTDYLAFGQTESDLVLDLRQVFGNDYISQRETSFQQLSGRSEYSLPQSRS